MAKKFSEPPIVHIFGPRFPHDPVEIIGSEKGLERLINALIDAVSIGRGSSEIRSSDNFDSEVRAICLRGSRRPEEWNRSGSPYWDVDDPLMARLLDLTEENRRLRGVVSSLRFERKSIDPVELLEEASEEPRRKG